MVLNRNDTLNMRVNAMKWSSGGLGVIAALALALAGYPCSSFAGGNAASSGILYGALRLNATQLDLRGTGVSDADLKELSDPAFADVETALLARTRISDAGVKYLRHLKLRELDLYRTPITDAGLAHLEGLPIEILNLTGTAVTDAGLAFLSEMPLSRLILRNTAVAGDGLAQLGSPTIHFLDLSFSRITDANLAAIADWEQLEIIDLSETSITDKGFLQLLEAPKLAQVHISGTGVTQEGMIRFQIRRPSVKIISEAPFR